MATGGFLRALASGTPLLTTSTTITIVPLLQPASASTSSSTPTTSKVVTTGTTTSGNAGIPTDFGDAITIDGTTTTSVSSASTDDVLPAGCSTVKTDCEDDEACSSCLQLSSPSSTSTGELRACGEASGVGVGVGRSGSVSPEESSIPTCSDYIIMLCCLDQFSEFACLENDPFVELWSCFLDISSCGEEEVSCDGDAAGASNGDTGVATTAAASVGNGSTFFIGVSCAFMVVLSMLWV